MSARLAVAGQPEPVVPTEFSLFRGGLLYSLGVRLGLVSGYDGRFMRIARDTPVLPLVQPFATIDVGHLGVEISYTFVIVSIATSIRF